MTASASLRNLRWSAIGACVALIAFAGAYSWVRWHEVKQREERYMASLAELGSKSLDAYFAALEGAFVTVAETMVDSAGGVDEVRATKALQLVKRTHPELRLALVTRIDGEGDYRTLDVVGWFDAHDAYRRHISGDKYAVACPWEADHSNESGPFDTSTVVWEARGALWPSFHCSHAHCEGRNVRDVLALWGDADRFCRRAWRTS
jgi:hypothetical protein